MEDTKVLKTIENPNKAALAAWHAECQRINKLNEAAIASLKVETVEVVKVRAFYHATEREIIEDITFLKGDVKSRVLAGEKITFTTGFGDVTAEIVKISAEKKSSAQLLGLPEKPPLKRWNKKEIARAAGVDEDSLRDWYGTWRVYLPSVGRIVMGREPKKFWGTIGGYDVSFSYCPRYLEYRVREDGDLDVVEGIAFAYRDPSVVRTIDEPLTGGFARAEGDARVDYSDSHEDGFMYSGSGL